MHTSDFNYHLPPESIAQTPVTPRDQSKLMVVDCESNKVEHKHFCDLDALLQPDDVLVCNNSAVIPARLFVHKKRQLNAIEIFLLKETDTPNTWKALAKPRKKLITGETLFLLQKHSAEPSSYVVTIVSKEEDGTVLVSFAEQPIKEIWKTCGNTPLPPYITEREADTEEKYQTIYADRGGSVAAPTAGLHFTPELMQRLLEKGISIEYVELQVGLGTFKPVKADTLEGHHMHSEWCQIDSATANRLNAYKSEGRRIIAVGTTSVRVLESVATDAGVLAEQAGETDIFIYPGYTWKFVDGLITNFHLPQSTLLMLVSSLWDRERLLDAYEVAVAKDYRFYSFGDAMLIV